MKITGRNTMKRPTNSHIVSRTMLNGKFLTKEVLGTKKTFFSHMTTCGLLIRPIRRAVRTISCTVALFKNGSGRSKTDIYWFSPKVQCDQRIASCVKRSAYPGLQIPLSSIGIRFEVIICRLRHCRVSNLEILGAPDLRTIIAASFCYLWTDRAHKCT